MKTRAPISAVLSLIISVTLFAPLFLMVIGFTNDAGSAGYAIAVAAILSISLSVLLGWLLAPRVRTHFWDRRDLPPQPVFK